MGKASFDVCNVPVSACGSTSSSGESGAFANGELRVGRVLGLPSPNPNGEVEATAGTGTGALGNGLLDESSGGDPGGVVLPASVVLAGNLPSPALLDSGGEGEGEDDEDKFRDDNVGFGVVDGDLDWG